MTFAGDDWMDKRRRGGSGRDKAKTDRLFFCRPKFTPGKIVFQKEKKRMISILSLLHTFVSRVVIIFQSEKKEKRERKTNKLYEYNKNWLNSLSPWNPKEIKLLTGIPMVNNNSGSNRSPKNVSNWILPPEPEPKSKSRSIQQSTAAKNQGETAAQGERKQEMSNPTIQIFPKQKILSFWFFRFPNAGSMLRMTVVN